MKKYSLLIGKKRINLWKDSGISGDTCGRIYSEYYVTLPGGYQLPAALCVETYVVRDEQSVIAQQDPYDAMRRFAEEYTLSQMIAGQICSERGYWQQSDALWILQQSYVCHEMIGILRQEQIGDIHE